MNMEYTLRFKELLKQEVHSSHRQAHLTITAFLDAFGVPFYLATTHIQKPIMNIDDNGWKPNFIKSQTSLQSNYVPTR